MVGGREGKRDNTGNRLDGPRRRSLGPQRWPAAAEAEAVSDGESEKYHYV
jgi:hypothetical protein